MLICSFTVVDRAEAIPTAAPTVAPTNDSTVKIKGGEARAILVAYSNLESLEARKGKYQPLELYDFVRVTDEGTYYDVLFQHELHVTPKSISGIHGNNYEYKIRKGDFIIEGYSFYA